MKYGTLSLNCKGMPNLGYAYYRDLWKGYTSRGITYVLSVDAADPKELKTMLCDYNVHLEKSKTQDRTSSSAQYLEWVELNVSCPNKLSPTEYPRLLSYDPDGLSSLLSMLRSLNLHRLSLSIKLAPFCDRWLLAQIAQVLIVNSDIVRCVVCSNSVPNAFSPTLFRSTSGMSGLPAKLLAQANIAQLASMFSSAKAPITLVGCGGVETREDALEYLKIGAAAVQVGRTLLLEGRAKLAELQLPQAKL